MMPPPSRIERQPRALLLPGLLCVILTGVSCNISAGHRCPLIECAEEGRHFCEAGSPLCGPCLRPLEEVEGKCVKRKRRPHGKVNSFPDLDEEIDLLSSIIAKQQVSQQSAAPSHTGPKAQTSAPNPKGHGQPATSQPPTTVASSRRPPPPSKTSGRGGPLVIPYPSRDSLLLIMITLCVVMGTVALILAAVCWVRVQNDSHLTQKAAYPAFGGIGPSSSNSTSAGDNKLAQSAQMYHFQHQKQQMLSMEKHKDEPKVPESGATSDEENEDGDFTVYECPGLAPTGEMEVKNPLFDDSTLHNQRNHK